MMPCSGEAGGVAQPTQLALGLPSGLLGEAGLVEPLPQVADVAALLTLPKLLLDRTKLFTQEVLALALGDPLARVGGDLLAQLTDSQLVLEQIDQPGQLGVQRVQLQQLLADRGGEGTVEATR